MFKMIWKVVFQDACIKSKKRCRAVIVFPSMIANAGIVKRLNALFYVILKFHQRFAFLILYGSQIVAFLTFQKILNKFARLISLIQFIPLIRQSIE